MTITPRRAAAAALLFACPVLGTHAARADNATIPNRHAPIGVMGDHLHDKGEVMVSVRYMRMQMEGMREGTNSLSLTQTQQQDGFQYVVVPDTMPMDMVMAGAMYGLTNRITLMAMGSYIWKSMDHYRDPAGTLPPIPSDTFETQSEGFGDVKLSALVGLFKTDAASIHLNLGVSLPTGDIEARDVTPAAPNGTILPYPMQIGSGTYDFLPGITYNGYQNRWGWGAQLSGIIRTGDNDQNYTLGDEIAATGWLSYLFTDYASGSVRLAGRSWGEIDGEGPDRSMIPTAGNPMLDLVPTIRGENFGGERLDLSFGLNFAAQNAGARGHRLGLEFGIPVYQDLNGPQMETDWTVTLGWQKTL
ncbi:MAG: transporter [Pseudomonadota bacterium]